MSIEIKKAGEEDLQNIHKMAYQIWPATYASILSAAQINYMLQLFYAPEALIADYNKIGYSFFLILLNKKEVGFAGVEIKDNKTAHLHKIYLSPNHQGKGLGKKSIQHIISFAKNTGANSLTLNVNRYNKALHFYKALNFKIIKEVDIEIGNGYFMNDYVMQISI